MGFRYATSLIFDNRSNVRKQIICHLRLQDITIDGFTHPSFFVFQTFVYPAIDKTIFRRIINGFHDVIARILTIR